MMDLYAWNTGNGQRGCIAVEEFGVPYKLTKVDLSKGEQKKPEFLAKNPMGQIPVLVDPDGPGGKPVTLSQSGAILMYLAEKTGKFVPKDAVAKAKVLEWTMNACTDTAVTSGAIFQVSVAAKEKVPSIIEHFENRLVNYLRAFEGQLNGRKYLTGNDVTIADLALFSIVNARKPLIEKAGGMPNLLAWTGVMAAREPIQRALKALA
ncbi:MAG TPA: glutathione S-transferase family protein [bacterium]